MIRQTNKQKTLLSLPILIVLLVILIIAFGCGCAFDKQISEKIYVSNKALNIVIGGTISNIGLQLGYFAIFVTGFSLVISSYVYKDKQKWKTITTNAILIPLLVAFIIILGYSYGEWKHVTKQDWSGITINTCLLVLTVAGSFCLSWFYIRKLNQEKIFKVMFWILMFMIILALIRTLMCLLWSRPRPKAVFDDTTPIDYHPVWILQPFKCFDKSLPLNGLRKSFPSGHTTGSGFVLGLIIALYKIDDYKNKNIPYILLGISILLIVITGLGRMISGWHFLTDVSFGGILPIALFTGMEAVINKRISM